MSVIKQFIEKCRDVSDPRFVSYIKSRGLDTKDVAEFNLGFYKWTFADGKNLKLPKIFDKSILIPSYDDLAIPVGFELRSTGGKNHFKQYDETARYHFFGMTPRALDAIYSTESVFLTEGTFDAMSLALWKPNILSLMSNKISDGHLLFLRRYVKNVYLCFDLDKGGGFGNRMAGKELSGLNVSKFAYIKTTDMLKTESGAKRVKDANDLLKALGKDSFVRTVSTRFSE